MVDKIQIIRALLEFVRRVQLNGDEADMLVLCKHWLREQEAAAATEIDKPESVAKKK